ncbi:hypothetical protein LR48_Vigan03g079600 [Vigna angularis]|uniref:Uncharacterized protein n=1 Tax=Phaseolus angularis TaxID=3914 RepID=A0A0L9U4U2_PHAAN|nr:hypothetical protein LR48_Vigan03g079600 [Vigna angularis]
MHIERRRIGCCDDVDKACDVGDGIAGCCGALMGGVTVDIAIGIERKKCIYSDQQRLCGGVCVHVLKASLDERKHDYYLIGSYNAAKDKFIPDKGFKEFVLRSVSNFVRHDHVPISTSRGAPHSLPLRSRPQFVLPILFLSLLFDVSLPLPFPSVRWHCVVIWFKQSSCGNALHSLFDVLSLMQKYPQLIWNSKG